MTTAKSFTSLVYHRVSPTGSDDPLTVTAEEFEQQLIVLNQKGYNAISFSDLIDHEEKGKGLPEKPVLITFDDGFRDTFTVAYPLLAKHRIKANVFLVSSFVTSEEQKETRKREFLTPKDLKCMDPDLMEFGLHTAGHINYKKSDLDEIREDLRKCIDIFNKMKIKFQPCLAYPYGAYPKKDPEKCKEIFEILSSLGVKLGFRLGNRINRLPVKNKFLVQRVEVRNKESLWRFKLALRFGKKLLFVTKMGLGAEFSNLI